MTNQEPKGISSNSQKGHPKPALHDPATSSTRKGEGLKLQVSMSHSTTQSLTPHQGSSPLTTTFSPHMKTTTNASQNPNVLSPKAQPYTYLAQCSSSMAQFLGTSPTCPMHFEEDKAFSQHAQSSSTIGPNQASLHKDTIPISLDPNTKLHKDVTHLSNGYTLKSPREQSRKGGFLSFIPSTPTMSTILPLHCQQEKQGPTTIMDEQEQVSPLHENHPSTKEKPLQV